MCPETIGGDCLINQSCGNMDEIFDYRTKEQREQFKPVPIELKLATRHFIIR